MTADSLKRDTFKSINMINESKKHKNNLRMNDDPLNLQPNLTKISSI